MNWKKWTLQTFEYIFYGVVLLQVFFGSIWMIHQFPHVQSWQQTLEYLEISQSFVLDEYVGFLYPVFLRIFTEVENLIGIPYCVPVYVVQLGVALWAGWLFSRNVFKNG